MAPHPHPPPPPQATYYSAKEMDGTVAFLKNVAVAFEKSDEPAAGAEFFALFSSLGEGGDAGAVVGRAAEILDAHPDLLAQFWTCLAGGGEKEVPAAASSSARPRRSNRRRTAVRTMAGADPSDASDESDGAVAVVVLEERNETKLRLKAEKEGARRAAASASSGAARRGETEKENPLFAVAVEYVRRVKELGGEEVYRRFVKMIHDVRDDPGMPAAEIYDRARAALGPDLLPGLVTFLPGRAEWEAQQQHKGKRPRQQETAGADGVGGGPAAPLLLLPPKKRRLQQESSGSWSRGNDDDHHDTTARCSSKAADKTKQPRATADDSNSRRPLRTSEGGAGSARVQDPTTSRRATGSLGGGTAAATRTNGGEFGRFRAFWEFETEYTVLASTIARTEEMARAYPDHGVDRSKDDSMDVASLFPSHETREFLERFYGAYRWRRMEEGLAQSRLIGRTLAVVLGSLRWAKERAVQDARKVRNPARAAEGLERLVADRVAEERRRGSAGDRRGI